MSILNDPKRARREPVAVAGVAPATSQRVSSDEVWRALSKASFAVVSHVTPGGEPRSSGVVYTLVEGRLYVAVAKESWKARHIAASGTVAVTVPVRRGGIMSLVMPIPPATISFHGSATVHAGEGLRGAVLAKLGRLLPSERRAACSVLEICPVGHFVTYGLGVSLRQMRDTALARARVRVVP
jgi:pyridoxamine 5'-phosphate oxidase-like protein